MKREISCISCPMGCSLEVTYDDEKMIDVKGNECPRGKEYAKREIFRPERVVTTTVKIKGASIQVLPVKTKIGVAKNIGREIVRAASKIEVNAPVKAGDVIIENICGTGVDLIATRTLKRR